MTRTGNSLNTWGWRSWGSRGVGGIWEERRRGGDNGWEGRDRGRFFSAERR